ncbi:MAG: DUF262 domain-containing protein [Anaerolineaceae bacterium]|nr:DUF262 domain-containing protein [Anaerolineaceae bacterium]
MKTSATNRRLRTLLTDIRDKKLSPHPEFQRRLVWTNKDKCAFIDTVLNGYPFPEIYIAAGEVDTVTGDGKEVIVDGQQRVTTLLQYFNGSKDIKLTTGIRAYKDLEECKQKDFLEYEVVVRDLGQMPISEIKEIFTRINSTNYALNAMEIQNARFEGEFKKFAEDISQSAFFEDNRVFRVSEIRRMLDTQFALTLIITIMSTYFHRNTELGDYLYKYNDEFNNAATISEELNAVFEFINRLEFDTNCRVWQKADLLTILVEIHRLLINEEQNIDPKVASKKLKHFYSRVDLVSKSEESNESIIKYHNATQQGTNNRSNRILRGEFLRRVILGDLEI